MKERLLRYKALAGFLIFLLFTAMPSQAQQNGNGKTNGNGNGKKNIEYKASFYRIIDFDEEDRRLAVPRYVYVDRRRGEIYVLDARGSRILIYNSFFYPILTIDKGWGINIPLAVTTDPEGNLYVLQITGESQYKISIYDQGFVWQRDLIFKKDIDFQPSRLAVNKKGEIYLVVTNNNNGVMIIDRDGNVKETLSVEEYGEKVPISDVKIDKEGWIYLTSIRDSRIFVFDENHKLLYKFGEKGGVSGKLSQPYTVGVDEKNGYIYVVDPMRHSVSVYSREDGTYLYEFGGRGWSEGWFQFPSFLDVDGEGRVIVADQFNDRLQVFVLAKNGSDNLGRGNGKQRRIVGRVPEKRAQLIQPDRGKVQEGVIASPVLQ